MSVGPLELVLLVIVLLVGWLVWRLARRGTSSTTTARSYRPSPTLSADVAAQAWELERARQRIQAIKLVREHTGMGLREAKDAVEALARQPLAPVGGAEAAAAVEPAPAAADGFNELELEGIRSLVADGQTIEAIKLVRERTGLGLAEAKDLVERLGGEG